MSKISHPSFGMIGASRVQSSKGRLFGSPLNHLHYVTLTIQGAVINRSLSEDRIFAAHDTPYIEVALTEMQWGQFLSTMNIGEGVPCTIRRVRDGEGKYRGVEEPPLHTSTTETYSKEIEETAQDALKRVKAALDRVTAMMSGPVKKSDLKSIQEDLRMACQEAEQNLPFVVNQCNEAIESLSAAAKADIAQYAALHTVGAITERRQQALSAPDSEE